LNDITILNSITSVGYGVFRDCTGLTNVTVGNSVTSIGDYAFYNCSVLNKITMLTNTPPAISANTFTRVDKTSCLLIVPDGSKASYVAVPFWSEFINIKELNEMTTNVKSNKSDNIKIYSTENEIVIEGILKGSAILVYSLNCKMMKRVISEFNKTILYVPKNSIYLVKTSGKTVKVIL
jgi:hypothetical protein